MTGTPISFTIPLLISSSVDGAMITRETRLPDVAVRPLPILNGGERGEQRMIGKVHRLTLGPATLHGSGILRDRSSEVADIVAGISQGYEMYVSPIVKVGSRPGSGAGRRLLAVRLLAIPTWPEALVRLTAPKPIAPTIPPRPRVNLAPIRRP
jgi:hypothetical protein